MKNLPSPRSRSRLGLAALDWRIAPTPDDMWPDKVEVEIQGHVDWPDGVSFHDYVSDISSNRHMAQAATIGRRFRSSISYGNVAGRVSISMSGQSRADERSHGRARIKLSLYLNVTATRAGAIRRNAEPIDTVNLYSFFAQPPTAQEVMEDQDTDMLDVHALDGKENFFRDAREAGGTSSQARVRVRNDFLHLFEDRLRELIEGLLTPNPVAPLAEPDPLGEARQHIEVVLDWPAATLRRAEVYVERSTASPLAIVKRIYDRGSMLARAVRTAIYSDSKASARFLVELGGQYPHIVIPLTGAQNIEMSIYAKTRRRVRFEVRYRSDFSRLVKSAASDPYPIATALLLLIEDAADRLPWQQLQSLDRVPPEANVGDICDLLEALASATKETPTLYSHVMSAIVLTGSLQSDEERFPALPRVISHLVKAGVLERQTFQKKEARGGRRYGLTERHRQTRHKMLEGFVPDSDDWANLIIAQRGSRKRS